jgi:AcrR family transcriptional regulator
MYTARVDSAERLVTSTQQLLWERGYVGTSPRAIQQLAGAGQGSMYHHFKGKPDLAVAAIRRNAAELRALATAELAGEETPLARLSGYLTRERDPLRGCRVGRLAMDPEVVADPRLREPVEETFAWLREVLADLVAEAVRAGELRADLDPRQTAAAIAATVQGGYVLARAAGDRAPFDEAVRGALALLEAAAPSPVAPSPAAAPDN